MRTPSFSCSTLLAALCVAGCDTHRDAVMGPDTGPPNASVNQSEMTPAGPAAVYDVTLTDLGTFGGSQGQAYAVNRDGIVAGWAEDGSRRALAFRWSAAGGMQSLGTLGGESRAYAINEAGAIAGASQLANGQTRAFVWTEASGMRDVGTLGGDYSIAFGINDSGQVVGASRTAAGVLRAFVWTDADGMTDLGSLGGQSAALDVNEHGDIVGWSHTPAGVLRAVLWTAPGAMQDLGDLGGNLADAMAINAGGQVVGRTRTGIGGPALGNHDVAFRWSAAEGMHALPRTFSAAANGIDDDGTIVGFTRLHHLWWLADHSQITVRTIWPRPFVWTAAGGTGDLGVPHLGRGSALAVTGESAVGWTAAAVGHASTTLPITGVRPALWTVRLLPVQSLAVDIKPGSDPNSIIADFTTPARIAVALLSTALFDAAAIDPATVGAIQRYHWPEYNLQPAAVVPVARRRNGMLMAGIEDVDGDGRPDLVVHFERSDLLGSGMLPTNATELCFVARTLERDAAAFGCDAVRVIIPPPHPRGW
jgi:probable HAF family extracellular repeat protein